MNRKRETLVFLVVAMVAVALFAYGQETNQLTAMNATSINGTIQQAEPAVIGQGNITATANLAFAGILTDPAYIGEQTLRLTPGETETISTYQYPKKADGITLPTNKEATVIPRK